MYDMLVLFAASRSGKTPKGMKLCRGAYRIYCPIYPIEDGELDKRFEDRRDVYVKCPSSFLRKSVNDSIEIEREAAYLSSRRSGLPSSIHFIAKS